MAADYRLVRRNGSPTRHVRVGSATFGDGFTLVGGPCSIESVDQMQTVAKHVRAGGGAMLRGGAFKPRTSPYDFQGLGQAGIEIMRDIGLAYGLPTVVEALAVDDVENVAASCEMIQIGARNMQHVPLLRAAARTGAAILLKRGPSATLDELLCAAEYILIEGNDRVVLCERGIRSFDPETRNVFDLAGALRLQELTHLPVIVDPSHACGRRSLIEPLTYAAAAAGIDGAMIEVHPDPDRSVSDAAQAIDGATFERIGSRVFAFATTAEQMRVR